MTVAAALVLMGTAVTTKAASLLKVSDVSISKDKGESLVLKHASQIFGDSEMSMTGHRSHGSHGSHSSHSSHSSHYSSY
ncbi:MAG TPA: hypothetical protein DEH02_08630 [Bacteroidales bacterium]|nr:hypothetical protein [Bacteroidales bacterium]